MTATKPFEDILLEVVEPILESLRLFERCGRFLSPHSIETITAQLKEIQERLRVASLGLQEDLWPPPAEEIRESVSTAYRHALKRLELLEDMPESTNVLFLLYRTLGARAPMCEALYPLAQHFSLIHRFFLDARKGEKPRLDQTLEAGLLNMRGIHHIANDRKQRGGYSIYIPESYDASRQYPLVFALHGGSGHGATFLWSWLRTARTEELVLVSPTSLDATWPIMGTDRDTLNMRYILDSVQRQVNVDETKRLLTGMSDGGTFTYVSGCTDESPFTHLAPCSASFHPLLLESVSRDRLNGLPICITHGALDWMFTVDVAQTAAYAFTSAGANVHYREIADLAHVYPEDANPELVDWFLSMD